MASNVSFNPMLTTNAYGSFSAYSDGFVQGVMMDDPSVRFLIDGGPLAITETLPMWGGVALFNNIPAGSTTGMALGTPLGRATSVSQITGFSVTNQATNWVTSPQSEAPSAGAGMTVPYVRLRSNARVAVQCSTALASLSGGLIGQQVSWDFGGQQLIPYVPAYAEMAPTAEVYNSTNGQLMLTFAVAPGFAPGDYATLAGYAAPYTLFNGSWYVITTATAGTVVTLQCLPGLGAITPAGGYLVAGGGALPVQVLDVQVGNSKVITYDAVNNLVHWTSTGSAALILI
jgi:hypothetical protein